MKIKDTAIKEMNRLGTEKEPFFFLVDFHCEEVEIFPLKNLSPNICRYNFKGNTNSDAKKNSSALPEIQIIHPISYEDYQREFTLVQKEITRGNTYLINLTAETEISLNASLEDVFEAANADYKILLQDQFVCFSPETFIQIHDNRIYSFPMKGTIDGNIPHAQSIILQDPKETAEHYTIVDLIRNDLNLVAKNVRVERFRYTQEIKSRKGKLLQLSSEICGELTPDWTNQIGTILSILLPAGSISGAPKEKTVSIIHATENYNRVYYTGIAGLFDGKSLDTCVLIRFIEKRDNRYFYKSGGGITCNSIAQKEYEELLQKIYIPTR